MWLETLLIWGKINSLLSLFGMLIMIAGIDISKMFRNIYVHVLLGLVPETSKRCVAGVSMFSQKPLNIFLTWNIKNFVLCVCVRYHCLQTNETCYVISSQLEVFCGRISNCFNSLAQEHSHVWYFICIMFIPELNVVPFKRHRIRKKKLRYKKFIVDRYSLYWGRPWN